MGCLLCNITNLKTTNKFYCKTQEEKKDFRDELAYDIARNHPEMVKLIEKYKKEIKNA